MSNKKWYKRPLLWIGLVTGTFIAYQCYTGNPSCQISALTFLTALLMKVH